ncbi:hypothetical protein CDD82_4973 [Ophiocordyceps australis]|uniref:EamA domain-containing protein n=1 Tax=Ophiocordyceps australis TaxID=1399860 RepID=A0A2C5Z2Y2_9HYPO|nr:hypothetical protein CDD82_4973 [Ophiocordyceps australis]
MASSCPAPSPWASRTQWLGLAVASGACAAFNGVFAKLTTTHRTSYIAAFIARLTHLESTERLVDLALRAIFFILNLSFNGIMWTLFTKALASGSSTTQVSIVNTSTNFVLTALLGLAVFSESLPSLWWAGAALLVAGNVIIGSKDDDKSEPPKPFDAASDSLSTSVDADESKPLLRPSLRSVTLVDEDVPHLEPLLNDQVSET